MSRISEIAFGVWGIFDTLVRYFGPIIVIVLAIYALTLAIKRLRGK